MNFTPSNFNYDKGRQKTLLAEKVEELREFILLHCPDMPSRILALNSLSHCKSFATYCLDNEFTDGLSCAIEDLTKK